MQSSKHLGVTRKKILTMPSINVFTAHLERHTKQGEIVMIP